MEHFHHGTDEEHERRRHLDLNGVPHYAASGVPLPSMTLSNSTNNLLQQASQQPDTQLAAAAGAAAATSSLDLTELQSSMDAALAEIVHSEQKSQPDTVSSVSSLNASLSTSAPAVLAAPTVTDEEKQAQLRAMYLAGFRAAHVRNHQQSQQQQHLRHNFEKAAQVPSGLTQQMQQHQHLQQQQQHYQNGPTQSTSSPPNALLVPLVSSPRVTRSSLSSSLTSLSNIVSTVQNLRRHWKSMQSRRVAPALPVA